MYSSRTFAACLTFLIALSLPTVGIAQSKVPVLLETTFGDDTVGQQVGFELKEAIRGSQSFRLIAGEGVWPRITIIMVSTSSAPSSGPSSISYSFLYDSLKMPMRGAFVTSTVQICSRQNAQGCARAILANIDDALERLSRNAPDLRKTFGTSP